MTNILICPIDEKNYIELNNKEVDGFIIGLKNYSVYLGFKLDIQEIEKLENRNFFVAINKPLYNKDIPYIKEALISLSKMNILGILFEDISIVNMNIELNLNLNLVWAQIHLPTNYHTCNFWYKEGIKTGLLSTEITLENLKIIKDNTNMKLMVYIYGYLPMFESSRELLTNFFIHKKDKIKDKLYYIYEEERNKYYLIYEENNETYILDSILNGLKESIELKDHGMDYFLLNGLFQEYDEFNYVIDEYIDVLKYNKPIDSKYLNTEKGFLYKDSIYRVKSNE